MFPGSILFLPEGFSASSLRAPAQGCQPELLSLGTLCDSTFTTPTIPLHPVLHSTLEGQYSLYYSVKFPSQISLAALCRVGMTLRTDTVPLG